MLSRNENGNGADSEVLALQALAWIVSDETRAERLLSLTGLDADQLRNRIGEPALLNAALDFLLAHEPDLVGCADALGLAPEQLASLAGRIGR